MNETDDTGDRHRARGREATDRRAASVRNRSNKQTGARPSTAAYRDASCTVAAYLQCSAPRLVRGRRRCRLSIAVARVCCVARRGAVGRWTRRLHGRRVHQCPSIRQGTASKLTKITERERERLQAGEVTGEVTSFFIFAPWHRVERITALAARCRCGAASSSSLRGCLPSRPRGGCLPSGSLVPRTIHPFSPSFFP